jgi:hypothetical protein
MLLNSDTNRFKLFPRNVKAAVTRVRNDQALRWAVAAEAKTHHVELSGVNFDWMLPKIVANKIQAYSLDVSWDDCAWENCNRFTAGGATEFLSVITVWDGKKFNHYPATHGEDTYVSPELSSEFRQRTTDASHPNGARLGTYFVHERIRLAVAQNLGLTPYGMISRGRVGEYSAHSTAMIKMFNNMGATMGSQDKGNILQLNGFPESLRKRFPVDIQTEGLGVHLGDFQPNIFVTNWSGKNGEKIVASFTEAISTFNGQPIVRVQFTTNQRLPDNETLKDALASLIMAGRAEILERKRKSLGNDWMLDDEHMIMRIHALNEPIIGLALQEMGANVRTIGIKPNEHPMLPLITDFNNIPRGLLDFEIPQAIPFITTSLLPARRQVLRVTSDLSSTALATATT